MAHRKHFKTLRKTGYSLPYWLCPVLWQIMWFEIGIITLTRWASIQVVMSVSMGRGELGSLSLYKTPKKISYFFKMYQYFHKFPIACKQVMGSFRCLVYHQMFGVWYTIKPVMLHTQLGIFKSSLKEMTLCTVSVLASHCSHCSLLRSIWNSKSGTPNIGPPLLGLRKST